MQGSREGSLDRHFLITAEFVYRLRKAAVLSSRATGIRNGMMFMQCKVKDDECIVYDIGYRLTGSLEYSMPEKLCGYNPLKMMICFAVTGDISEPDIDRKAENAHGIRAFQQGRGVKAASV